MLPLYMVQFNSITECFYLILFYCVETKVIKILDLQVALKKYETYD